MILVNNPTNNNEGEYEIHISEDNWVFAPYGGILNSKGTVDGYMEEDKTIYLSDEAFFIILKAYHEKVNPNMVNAKTEKGDMLEKSLYACSENLKHVESILYDYDNFVTCEDKNKQMLDVLKDYLKGYNPSGDIATVAGIVVAETIDSTPIGVAISVVGLAISFENQYLEYMISEYNKQIYTAMYEGNYNISFTEHYVSGLGDEKRTKSVDVWEKNYINKYHYTERETNQRGTLTLFTVYDLRVNGDVFSVIPRS